MRRRFGAAVCLVWSFVVGHVKRDSTFGCLDFGIAAVISDLHPSDSHPAASQRRSVTVRKVANATGIRLQGPGRQEFISYRRASHILSGSCSTAGRYSASGVSGEGRDDRLVPGDVRVDVDRKVVC